MIRALALWERVSRSSWLRGEMGLGMDRRVKDERQLD